MRANTGDAPTTRRAGPPSRMLPRDSCTMIASADQLGAKHRRLAEVAAIGFVALILSAAMVQVVAPSRNEAIDFFRDYSSARNLLSGKPLYAPLEQSLREYLKPAPPVKAGYNGHPPASVLLVIPFARTDYVHATMLWGWASLIALGVSLVIMVSELNHTPSVEEWLLLLVALTVWPPLWLHILYGQFGLVLLLLITLAWRAGRRELDAQAGCFIGLAAAIKIFPAALLLYFAMRRRWRAVVFGGVSFLVVNAVTLPVVGFRAYQDYLAFGTPQLAAFYAYARNSSLTGFFSRLFSPPLSQSLILISSVVILATIWRIASRKRSDFDGEFGLMVTGTLLLCPLTWDHSFVLLLLPLAVCITRFSDAGVWRYLLIGSWILMAVPEPVLPGFSGTGTHSTIQSLSILSVNFYGLLACFIAQMRFPAAPRAKSNESA